jgi:hypothetical protein
MHQDTLTIPISKKILTTLIKAAGPEVQSSPSHSANVMKTSNVKTRVKQYNIFVVNHTLRATLSLRQKITESRPVMEKTSDKFWRIPKVFPAWKNERSKSPAL